MAKRATSLRLHFHDDIVRPSGNFGTESLHSAYVSFQSLRIDGIQPREFNGYLFLNEEEHDDLASLLEKIRLRLNGLLDEGETDNREELLTVYEVLYR